MRPSPSAIWCQVEASGRQFEVMLETSGKFEGMVHVFDRAKPKAGNCDVVISGARWQMGCLWVTDEDIFEHVEGLLDATELALFRKFAN